MFSIGLIFYELYYCFGTDQEKVSDFSKLRKAEMNVKFKEARPFEASIIRQLTAAEPRHRPSASEVLQQMQQINNTAVADLQSSLDHQKFESLDLKRQLSEKDELLEEKNKIIVELTGKNEEKDRLLEELTANRETKDQLILQLTAANSAYLERILKLETMLANQGRL